MKAWLVALACVWAVEASAFSLQEQQVARRVTMPLATGDSRILLDATLTSSAAATGAGFSLVGTGHVFDSNGFNGMGTGTLRIQNWAQQAQMAPQGTIYLQVERVALTLDESDNGGIFADSVGTVGQGHTRCLLNAYNDADTYSRSIFYNGSTDSGNLNFTNKANTTADRWRLPRYNSHAVPTYQDSRYAEIVWTWSGTDYWFYVDGHPLKYGVSAATPTSADWDNILIGSCGSVSNPLGTFYIKRVQISKTYVPPVMLPLRVGIYGDSFYSLGIQMPYQASPTVAQLDAVQTSATLTNRYANYQYTNAQTSWMHGLQALAWQNLGAYFPVYCGAMSGGGYEKSPIEANYRTGLNNFKPELIIAGASVNDVSTVLPASDIVANTKTMFDELIDGNPGLRKVLFFVGFNGHRVPTQGTIWLAEYKRVSALLVSGLANYRGKVQVIDVYEAWGGDNYPLTQTIGTAPTNVTATFGTDQHPSPTGLAKMTEIMWPYVRDFLTARPAGS